MMRRPLVSLLACLVLVAGLGGPVTALAHGGENPRFGGIVQASGETVFELVTRPDGVEIYLIDDHADAVAAEYSARIKVLSGGTTQDATLVPAGGNKFKAAGVKLAPGARAVVTVKKTSTGATATARFTIP